MESAYERTAVPRAVAELTSSSRTPQNAASVPSLGEVPWILVENVVDSALADAGAVYVKPGKSSETWSWHGKTLGRPEIEVVVLAKRNAATAVVENSAAMACARAEGVTIASIADILRDLEARGLIDDSGRRAKQILDTGYHSRGLETLAGVPASEASDGSIPFYDHKTIEAKWQKVWADSKAFAAPDRPDPAKKYYVLEMFPYPSGNLHMGHVRNYAIGDLIARFQRTQGKQVLHPMGWDAFGMPAENAAIKDGVHPGIRTPQNIANVKRQFQALGMSYDWDREIGTYLPEYYKWNQWFFLKFLERGLIYRADKEVNWCPKDNTVLANEQVVEGKCWRCETVVVKKTLPEWSFRITAYAQRLLDGIDELVAGGWPDRVTTMQRNWIGKSTGLECEFKVVGTSEKITVFTTRGDTIHGATYVVLAPEHPLVAKITAPSQKKDVDAFVAKMKATDKIARTAEGGLKEGVFTGSNAVNPFTGEEIPVWIANFVLADYGTGAVMSVPAHDQRDFEFAKKYHLPIRVVIAPSSGEAAKAGAMTEAFGDDGVLVDSRGFSGVTSAVAREKIAAKAEQEAFGKAAVKWHLRDWGFSRQRYWGTPIPIINCPKDGAVPVPEKDLPVTLPPDVTLTGEAGAPLAKVESFLNVRCPKCGGPAKREAETMDTFVDSTWYFARFLDPKNAQVPFKRDFADVWLPVDLYIGGPEHAVLHLPTSGSGRW